MKIPYNKHYTSLFSTSAFFEKKNGKQFSAPRAVKGINLATYFTKPQNVKWPKSVAVYFSFRFLSLSTLQSLMKITLLMTRQRNCLDQKELTSKNYNKTKAS